MAKSEATTARSPRGAKPVSQAFFTALETIPDATRAAVGKAAVAIIRDQMKMQREKARVVVAKEKAVVAKDKAAAKQKARKLAEEKPVIVKAATKTKAAPKKGASPLKRRGRKPAELSTAG
jgi:hypothetical protein